MNTDNTTTTENTMTATVLKFPKRKIKRFLAPHPDYLLEQVTKAIAKGRLTQSQVSKAVHTGQILALDEKTKTTSRTS